MGAFTKSEISNLFVQLKQRSNQEKNKMKCHAHGAHAGHGTGLPAAAKSGLIATGVHTGKTLLAKAGKHPVLLFGIGLAIGVYIHKNRKEILSEVNQSSK
jgi:hypothetical protein